jgi:LAO/AO transport system kinase
LSSRNPSDTGADALRRLRAGGKVALARTLVALERAPDDPASVALLDAAHADPAGFVLGITGPPGVGKSTLTGALVRTWRGAGRTVGVIAVDPSSRRSGGALLGDRLRLETDPEDEGVFVRSMAARDRLGGLAAESLGAMVLMRALYDRVVVETVGVGQSEADVEDVADLVLFCVQPGAGDAIQFMKAGIAEIPDLVAVTKSDLGTTAEQARRDVVDALGLGMKRSADALLVGAATGAGVADLLDRIEQRFARAAGDGTLAERRRRQVGAWLTAAVRERFGRDGLARVGALDPPDRTPPFARLAALAARLRR